MMKNLYTLFGPRHIFQKLLQSYLCEPQAINFPIIPLSNLEVVTTLLLTCIYPMIGTYEINTVPHQETTWPLC